MLVLSWQCFDGWHLSTCRFGKAQVFFCRCGPPSSYWQSRCLIRLDSGAMRFRHKFVFLMKYQAILSSRQAFRLGRKRARIVGRGVVFIRKGMLLNRQGVLSNKKETLFIRKEVLINNKAVLFIRERVLLNRKGIFSIRKEALFIRQGMPTNRKAPPFGTQTVRPSKFSCAASFFCLTKHWRRVYSLP